MADPAETLDSASDQFSNSLASTWQWLSNLNETTLIGIGLGAATVFFLIVLRLGLRLIAGKIPEKKG